METHQQIDPLSRVDVDQAGEDQETTVGALKRLAWVLPVTALTASVADVALYEVVGVLDPDVTAWPGAGLAEIVGANTAYLLMGAALLVVLVKFTSAPARWFTVLATVAVLASLALPVFAGLGDGSAALPTPGLTTVITLGAMHLVSYVIAVLMFLRLGRSRRR